MRAFSCAVCGNLLVAENSVCVTCGTAQGLSPATMQFVPVDVATGRSADGAVQCVNLAAAGCNWLVDDGRPDRLCLSCRLTRTRPNEQDPAGLAAWASTESAKRRLVYQLLDLGLPVVPRDPDGVGDPGDPVDPGHRCDHSEPGDAPNGFRGPGLAFDLLSSTLAPVTTGHADGVVTIDLAEGHDAHREALRVQMGEPYRTVLGHLRHEVGHYYWQLLVAPRPAVLQRFREVFGDERADYPAALQQHYAAGPPAGWAAGHVSAYATAHPWEDWAETFAHYLHIRDTLQTAAAYGMVVTGPAEPSAAAGDLVSLPFEDTVESDTIGSIVDTWLPLTYALNAVNRSMGKGDLYPFVLGATVIGKLGVVHDLVVAQPTEHLK